MTVRKVLNHATIVDGIEYAITILKDDEGTYTRFVEVGDYLFDSYGNTAAQIREYYAEWCEDHDLEMLPEIEMLQMF